MSGLCTVPNAMFLVNSGTGWQCVLQYGNKKWYVIITCSLKESASKILQQNTFPESAIKLWPGRKQCVDVNVILSLNNKYYTGSFEF